MLLKIFRKPVRDLNAIFSGHFIEAKAFYAWQFNRLPCVSFIAELDVSKAFGHINETYQHCIVIVYQHSWYDHKESKLLFNNTLFVLKDQRIVELANDYCQVLYTPGQCAWAMQVTKELAAFRKAEVKETRVLGFARQAGVN